MCKTEGDLCFGIFDRYPMKIRVLTIFPGLLNSFWETGMIRRALEQEKISASAIDIREYAEGRHRVTDDRPYGGGSGMVMKPEPLAGAIRAAKKDSPEARTVLLSPQGRVFRQAVAREMSSLEALILVCGRYEGVDERISRELIDDEISIGDYVLTGGEVPAMVVIDAVARLLPGVLGNDDSAETDSFSGHLLEHGHYTRPREFEGESVPEVLLSGDHQAIESWRREAALMRTFLRRPDLLANRPLDSETLEILKNWCRDIEAIIRAQPLRGADTLPGAEPER